MTPANEKVLIQINMNDMVWVRLTDFGRAYLKLQSHHWTNLPAEDADGWARWQLWHLMSTFGSVLGLGEPVPFETVFRVETNAEAVVVGLLTSG